MSAKPIDIYSYPEKTTAIDLMRYMLAVMDAAERGEPVEMCIGPNHWSRAHSPTWTWGAFKYRIARPKIAEGHNPDGLTEAQVGVQDGWRLLSVEEAKATAGENVPDTQWWIPARKWSGIGNWCAASMQWDSFCTLRTLHPPGHYLPKPAAEPVAETREETRRDRIATIVQLIRNGSETADQIAARIEALLAREIRPAVRGGAE